MKQTKPLRTRVASRRSGIPVDAQVRDARLHEARHDIASLIDGLLSGPK